MLRLSKNYVSLKIHPQDEMIILPRRNKKPDSVYFESGDRVVRKFKKIAYEINPSLINGHKVLDYGCAHGRITRHIPFLLKPSLIVVADVWREAVKFCADEFDAQPFVISNDNMISKMGVKFDLIFCVSVFTHLPPNRFESNLQALSESLSERGLIFMSICGEYIQKIKHVTLENGFYFRPVEKGKSNTTNGRLPLEEYNLMCVSPEFLENMVRKVGLRILYSKQKHIGGQDLHVLGF